MDDERLMVNDDGAGEYKTEDERGVNCLSHRLRTRVAMLLGRATAQPSTLRATMRLPKDGSDSDIGEMLCTPGLETRYLALSDRDVIAGEIEIADCDAPDAEARWGSTLPSAV